MSWTDDKVAKLKELWGKGKTANQIAEIIGGISRNAVIGKAHRLNLSAKIKTRAATSNQNFENSQDNKNIRTNKGRKNRFRSLIIEKDFEPENPTTLENLTDKTCRWPIGHPDEKDFYFCGRTPMDERIYCKLHVLHAYQPRGQKGEETQKGAEEVPSFIQKKVKRA